MRACARTLWGRASPPPKQQRSENGKTESEKRWEKLDRSPKIDTLHARELGRQLEAPDSRLRMETGLVALEENQKILERLEIEVESPAKGNFPALQIHLTRKVQNKWWRIQPFNNHLRVLYVD